MQQTLFPTSTPKESPQKSLANNQELNASQNEAVSTIDGPVLVIAGAGSGKTRTLTYRVAKLIEKGIPPEQILLLTFTRKSSQEMLYRASLLMDDTCSRVVGGTFHAVASNLLRRYGFHLGYSPQFTILDRSDSEGIINLIKSSLELSGAGKRFPSKRVIINIISQTVNKQLDLDALVEQRYWHLSEFVDDLRRICEHYTKFKLEHNLMDYDDLLVNLHKILKIKEVGAELSNRFTHIMVDEYQDTNHIQDEIVRLIAKPQNNVMVVGDDSQSIYSFRGADFRNIIDFPKKFTDCKLVTLEENYRSTQPILSLTNGIIANASEKYTKNLFTSILGGEKPLIYSAKNEAEQASFVGQTITRLIEEGAKLSEIAVLFRSGFHSYKLELELVSRQCPFEKRGGMKLTESAHIKDVLSYLRVIYNPQDNLAWNRILLLLDKVGPKTAQNILNTIKNKDDAIGALQRYKTTAKWKDSFQKLISTLIEVRSLTSPLEQFETVMGYYQDIFERVYHDDYPNRSKDLDQLQEIVVEYTDLESFIKDTALDPPETVISDGYKENTDSGSIVLSTVHSAKGLERDTVFVINLAEGKFPSGMAQTPEEIEEERRLLYVAATRAKKKLYLVYPREASKPGHFGEPTVISRFLDEIPTGLAVYPERVRSTVFYKKNPVVSVPAKKRALLDEKNIVGKRVRHPFFGEGEVVKNSGPRTVQVFFNRYGQKMINLDYVKMELL